MEEKILILGTKSYDFTNQQTGENIKGTKAYYLSMQKNGQDNVKGHLPMEISLDEKSIDKIHTVPGVYTCKYCMIAGKGNKPQLTIVGFEYKTPYKLEF